MSYHQPTVPTTTTSYLASTTVWPGIGGGTSQSDQLVQAGTENLTGPGGVAGAGDPWYELYPMQKEQLIKNFPEIHTGDAITVQILWSGPNQGGTASFIICDGTVNTCAYPQETPQAPAAFSGDVSEWIVERASTNGVLNSLVPFSTISITGASGTKLTSSGGQSSYTLNSNEPAGPSDMSNCAATTILATTTGLSAPGAFSVAYDATGVNESC